MHKGICLTLGTGAFLVAAVLSNHPAGGIDTGTPSRFRRPVALAVSEDGKRLFVANRRAGSVSVIDTTTLKRIAEADVGRTLADLTAGPAGRLLAVDEAAGELLVLARRGETLAVEHRLVVGASPVSVRAVGRRAYVACLWSRQVAVVEIPADAAPRLIKTISLPFAPRLQLPLPDGDKVVVTDSFGGKLAVIDGKAGGVDSVRELPAHNIRGLALAPGGKDLLLTHQLLFDETPTKRDEVSWGNVITNGVRVLSLAQVRQADADLLRGSSLWPLGDFGRGAADPAGIAVGGGRVVVALAGASEIALGPEEGKDWPRLRTGLRPTAVVTDAAGKRAFAANTFADSVSVVDIIDRKSIGVVSLGPTPAPGPAERGERLFFDGRLSKDGWMSCHSCHSDGHTNGRRSDTLGDGSYGAPKRVPSLLGVGDTGPWAWNGSMTELKTQVHQSIVSTMQGPKPSDEQVADIEAYLRTLTPPPPRGADQGSVRRGKEVFAARGCSRCHAPPTYTTPRTYDVGLTDEIGKNSFNPPSLRGVSQGLAFFHDGRTATLEEVFARHRHQVPKDLPQRELDDLLSFLRSL